MEDIRLLYIDLFCGAGGTSTGVEEARYRGMKCAKVIACVNHDANAIASHAANHPDALHFIEDIRTLKLGPLVKLVAEYRAKYPKAKVVLWASLECTNFSKAKGGQPRDADSRTLAEHLFRYIDELNPDFIQIENVEEFMCWGDLDENGKPISKDKGRLYLQWVENVKGYGYKFDHRILNAADYGAYTSRKRFFGIFAKPGLPIVFPQPTHSKNGGRDLFDNLQKWKPVREVLDLTDEGESIFTRKKPLADKTLERIYAGLVKFVAGGKDAFMIKYNSVNKKTGKHVPPSLDEPCPTVSCQNRLGVAKINFLAKNFSGHPESKVISVDSVAGSITTIDHHSLVGAEFISTYYGNGCNHDINDPAPTVTCKDRLSLINPKFIASSYSGGGQISSIENPCPAIMTNPKQRVVACQFIDQQYGQSKPTSIENPCGSITTKDKYSVVSCEASPWLMNTNFNNVGSDLEAPAPTITANRKQHYLMNPQYYNTGSSLDDPCFTLIARMDKAPPYLVETEEGFIAIEVYETDSEPMRRIKEFMALYGIADIKMRMLRIPELKLIQGFKKNYTLVGTQAEQKKFIGNAVHVLMAQRMCEALVEELDIQLSKAA